MGFETYKNELGYVFDESNEQARQVERQRLANIGQINLFSKTDKI